MIILVSSFSLSPPKTHSFNIKRHSQISFVWQVRLAQIHDSAPNRMTHLNSPAGFPGYHPGPPRPGHSQLYYGPQATLGGIRQLLDLVSSSNNCLYFLECVLIMDLQISLCHFNIRVDRFSQVKGWVVHDVVEISHTCNTTTWVTREFHLYFTHSNLCFSDPIYKSLPICFIVTLESFETHKFSPKL